MSSAKLLFFRSAITFLPFWFYIVLFKFGAGIHYSMLAILGSKILPLWAVGICVSFASLIELMCDIPAGFMLERYGYTKMLRITTLCFVVAAAALIIDLTPLTYFISLVFGAFGWLFFTPGINAYLLAHGPVSVIGRLMGLLRASEGVGITLSVIGLPFFVRLPVPAVGLVILYPLIGALAALTIGQRAHVPTLLPAHIRARRHVARSGRKAIIRAFRNVHPAGTALGLYTIFAAIMYGFIWFVFPLRISEGIATNVMSASMAALEFAIVVAGLTVARFADTKRKKVIILTTLMVLAVLGTLLGLTTHPVLIALCFCISLFDELLCTTLWSWIDLLATRNRQPYGIVTGVMNFLGDLGWTIGPVVASILMSTSLGESGALSVAGVAFAVVCILLFGVILRHPAHR